jgi:hypothetical protein
MLLYMKFRQEWEASLKQMRRLRAERSQKRQFPEATDKALAFL